MNRIELIEWFSKIEKDAKFNHEAVDIWPILKSDLFFHWYKQSNTSSQSLSKKKKMPFYNRIKKLVSFFLNISRDYRNRRSLYAGFSAHRAMVNGRFVNKFFTEFTHGGKSIEIEYGQIDSSKNYENYKDILFLEHLEPLTKLLNFFVKKRSYLYEEVIDVIRRFNVEVDTLPDNYIKKFEGKLHLIRVYSMIFSYLLKKLKVEKVYVLCYYNIQMFALVYAANKLGIITYDVQHGSQGPLHPMYFFSGLKSELGYPKTLPSNFWCWDEASASSLRNWLPPNRSERVENRGNPWINYSIQHHGTDYGNSINQAKNNIIVTLQEPVLSETLLEVIESLDSSRFIWWLRFHPRMMEKKEYWASYFSSKSIKNIEIDMASKIPLPILLTNSFLHISRYSGSIIEGCILGTRTFITDQIGIETYGYYIDNTKVFNTVDFTAKELLSLIESFDDGIQDN